MLEGSGSGTTAVEEQLSSPRRVQDVAVSRNGTVLATTSGFASCQDVQLAKHLLPLQEMSSDSVDLTGRGLRHRDFEHSHDLIAGSFDADT